MAWGLITPLKRMTYHGHVRDKLVSRAIKEKSLARNVLSLVNDIEDLQKIWYTLNTCYDRSEKYIAEMKTILLTSVWPIGILPYLLCRLCSIL
jgi:hypothetical protein